MELHDQLKDEHLTASQTITVAKRSIFNATAPYGYFTPSITVSEQPNTLLFHINLGAATTITHCDINIHSPNPQQRVFTQLVSQSGIQQGAQLNTSEYTKLKSSLLQAAQNYGYFDARFTTSTIHINRRTHQAQITLHLTTGARYRFGKITIQQSGFSTSYINRFMTFHEGDYFNRFALYKTRSNFASVNNFRHVQVKSHQNRARHLRVPVTVTLKPARKIEYMTGFGYGRDTGIRGTFNTTFNRLNRYGHTLKQTAQLSHVRKNIQLNYEIPGKHPKFDRYLITGAYSRIKQSNGDSKAKKIALGYSTERGAWKIDTRINYLSERYSLVNLFNTQADMFYPSLTLLFRHTDSAVNPRSGFSISLLSNGTINSLSNQDAFFQYRLRLRGLYTLPTETRLLLRSRVAKTYIKNLNHLPLSLQLFAGGTQSIRGYGYNSIGPNKNLFDGSAEIQQRVYHQFYLTSFYDTGNTTDKAFDFKKMNDSYGFGAAWIGPIGILELSAAKQLTPGKHRWTIQFSMGPFL